MMKKGYIFIIITSMLAMAACKPTEKGYKSAYDAALGKREAALRDVDLSEAQGGMQQVDGAQVREINGKKVYVLNQRITPGEEGMKLPGNYNVAVGMYKMITNSKSQSDTLKEEGLNAFPAKNTDGEYYTIAGSFSSMDEALEFYEKYKERKDRVYIGLPSSPIIIYSPK